MDPSKLRPLLPAPSPDSQDGRLLLASRGAARELPKKRTTIPAACGPCRKRKTKCDGGRPACDACKGRNLDCEYDRNPDETQVKALKRKYEELQKLQTPSERILDQLRTRSQVEAGAILQKIRRGEDFDDILREIEYGDLLIQSSLAPETRFRYEFPLSPRIPAYLLQQSSPYLGSLIYEWTSPLTLQGTTPGPSAPPNPDTMSSDESLAPYLKPYHAAEIIDAQLDAVVPSKWTKVCSDNNLMRKLLHSFFLQDHDWWTAFHKDYFLDDMAHMRHDFCSSLLVNAVLALACNYYRGLSHRFEFWNPKTLGYRFLAEARRLQEYERHQDKLTNIQAAMALHIVYSGAGSDKIGVAHTIQACAAAHRMGLFLPDVTPKSAKLAHAEKYLAWALFSWQSLICFHYFRPPLIKRPPDFALPDPAEDPSWYGEIWLKYPGSKRLYPSSSGSVFKARADFAVILNEAGQRLFGETGLSRKLSVPEIAEFYSRFKSWYSDLPGSISPREALLPSHLKLHMHYFLVLPKLLQSPSVLDEAGSGGRANVLELFGQLPEHIVLHSKATLEILLRAYYLRHGFDYLDSYLIALLMETCLAAIGNIKAHNGKEELLALQSTVILLAKGIYEQGRNLFLGQVVYQLVEGRMRSEEAEMLKRFVKHEPAGDNSDAGLQLVQMDWPVDIHSMADDPESKRLGDLVKQLKESSVTS